MFDSPWLLDMRRRRMLRSLHGEVRADVVVVGAGIAGMMTAYFLLKETKLSVAVVDAGKVAHGATGHNAGHVIGYFEQPFAQIVRLYGANMAARAQAEVEAGWELLDDLLRQEHCLTRITKVNGATGLSTPSQISSFLEDLRLQEELGVRHERMFVSSESVTALRVPAKYDGVYDVLPHEEILKLVKSKDRAYIAALTGKKACINSASLVEELAGKLLERYRGRFAVYEHTPVDRVIPGNGRAVAQGKRYQIVASHLALCTNGYGNYSIVLPNGNEETPLHGGLKPMVGYMAGLYENSVPHFAINYFPPNTERSLTSSYFYVTGRPMEFGAAGTNLMCIGGQDRLLEPGETYDPDWIFPSEKAKVFSAFLKTTMRLPLGGRKFHFLWHGLMGYTPNLIRWVGRDPRAASLLYNLGCNGAGILTSITGGKRIADILSGKRLLKSIFDIPK